MAEQRNASVHTVRSYRDTWRLFLRFVAEQTAASVAELTLADLTASEVSAFLEPCRAGTQGHDRHAQLPPCRDAQLLRLRRRTRSPTALAQCAEILPSRLKRRRSLHPSYLEPGEVEAILAQPDRSTIEGTARPRAARLPLQQWRAHPGGARSVSRGGPLRAPACVRLYGKGRKERVCPLWPETVSLAEEAAGAAAESTLIEPIFVNRYGEPLGASGVRFKLAAYVEAAAKTCRRFGRSV